MSVDGISIEGHEEDPTLKSILISEASPQDADALAGIWKQSMSSLASAYGSEITPNDFPKLADTDHLKGILLKQMSDPTHFRVLTALHGNEIVGFLGGEKHEEGNKINNIHLTASVHSWGGGKRLMNRIFDWFDPSKETSLEVALGNEKAQRLYEKFGFVVKGRSDITLPNGKIVEQLDMVKPASLPTKAE